MKLTSTRWIGSSALMLLSLGVMRPAEIDEIRDQVSSRSAPSSLPP